MRACRLTIKLVACAALATVLAAALAARRDGWTDEQREVLKSLSLASLGLNATGEYLLHDRLHLHYVLARAIVATHHLPLDDAPEAYRKFRDKEDGMVKVVFQP